MADAIKVENDLLNGAASEDDVTRQQALRNYGGLIGQLKAHNYLDADKAQKQFEAFNRKALEHRANNQIEADPSIFLKNLGSGMFDEIDVDKPLNLRRTVNAAISSAITIQDREQKVKREQADREIQVMFDQGAGSDVILQKLREYSAGGILTRTERARVLG